MIKYLCFFFLVILLGVTSSYSAEFDGVDSQISVGRTADLNNVAPYTFFTKFYALSGSGGGGLGYLWAKANGTAISKTVIFDGSTPGHEFTILVFYGSLPANFQWWAGPGPNVVSTRTWNSVCVVHRTASASTPPDIYINGKSVALSTGVAGVNFVADDDYLMRIGGRGDSTRTFHGYIEDTAIWNVALTKQEVEVISSTSMKRMPLQVRTNNLLRFYPLDDWSFGQIVPTGTKVRDLSPRNVHNSSAAITVNTIKGYGSPLTYP